MGRFLRLALVPGTAVLATAAAWTTFHALTDREAAPVHVHTMSMGVQRNEQKLVAPQPAAYKGLISRGARVYAANCFSCHGGVGNGHGPLAANLSTPARDFTDSDWMSSQSDGVFFTSVQRGVPGTPMPAFTGRLSNADIWAVVAYIRGFSPTIRLDSAPGGAPDDSGNSGLGKQLYEEQCAGCHGQSGDGKGAAASSMRTQPRNLSDQDWQAGRSDGQLAHTIQQGLPGTAMPAFGGDLTADQIDAVVGYLRRLADGVERPNPVSGWAQENYLAYCASCHGVNGDGKGVAAGRLDPAPRVFRNPAWMAGQTDQALANAIKNGRPGTAMPSFGAVLTDQEIAVLADYLRAFAGSAAIPGADSAYRYDPEAINDSPAAPR
ncbi:c-type cytochrome [Streptomyces caeni]|uniref:C-type cytochrome n=1 Tax=Streptomyces caeni TaxID=2307231 RepID=A0ABW4ISB3_9ACTN